MIQGLGNDLNDSLGTLTRRHETKPTRFRCLLRRVNIIRHMVDVTGRNYSGPSKVKCSASVARQMGTPDRPQVFAGDVCWIERQPDNKWLCVEIRNKTHCATSTDSDVEIDSTADTQNSYSAQGSFGITLTPLDLMPSPIEQLGQLTPFAERFPTPANDLCGIPQCTICAPDGYVAGMAIILSSDDIHPDGCWVWGFRCATCPIYQRTQVALASLPSVGGAVFQNVGINVEVGIEVLGHYAYIVIEGRMTVPPSFPPPDPSLYITHAKFWVYDMSDLDSPVNVYATLLDDVPTDEYIADTDMVAREASLWVTGVYTDGTPVGTPAAPTPLLRHYDISTPSAPTLTDEIAEALWGLLVTYKHYDTGTMTFDGNPRVIGFQSTGKEYPYADTPLTLRIFDETCSLVSSFPLTSTTYNPNTDARPAMLMCDNLLIVSPCQTGGGYVAIGVDLSDVTTPVELWRTAESHVPKTYLGGNVAYVGSGSNINLYENIDTATPTITHATPRSPFTDTFGDDGFTSNGFFLDDTCLYSAIDAQVITYGVQNQLAPCFSKRVGTLTLSASSRSGSTDKESDTLYIGTVQGSLEGGFLSTYSNVAP